MSRIGKQKISIPTGVTVTVKDGRVVVVGPKGELERLLPPGVMVDVKDNEVTVDVVNKENKASRSLWGTYAAHIKNMVKGVTDGWKKQLEINGVGYKVSSQGAALKIEVGFTNPVIFSLPKGIMATVEKNIITILGFDKEAVGEAAAQIRAIKKPEPYKGKGIKYVGETIRTKAGKAAKAGAAAA